MCSIQDTADYMFFVTENINKQAFLLPELDVEKVNNKLTINLINVGGSASIL